MTSPVPGKAREVPDGVRVGLRAYTDAVVNDERTVGSFVHVEALDALRAAILRALDAAVQAERERCAALAEKAWVRLNKRFKSPAWEASIEAATAIRSGGAK